jgi:indolepyruvate ferredoxin oxidoreductase alpha subunit
MPAIMELRIRACHVRGRFACKDNLAPKLSTRALIEEPAGFDYMRLAHPPVTFRHEKLKLEQRIPAAQAYIAQHGLNERFEGGRHADIGLVVQGGLYNALQRALQQLGLADAFGASEIPLLVLNVTYPLVPAEITGFAAGKHALLVLEEGSPSTSRRTSCRRCGGSTCRAPCTARTCCPAPASTPWR